MNGYIATCAHTTILNPTPQEPVLGPAADAVCAAHFALEAALRMLRPGVKAKTKYNFLIGGLERLTKNDRALRLRV